jgi:hypothetical protein
LGVVALAATVGASVSVASTTVEPGKPLLGILNMSQGPFNCCNFRIQNRWQGFHGSTLVQVFAGGMATSTLADGTPKTTVGIVVERRLRWPANRQISRRIRRTPREITSLRIVKVSGQRLILKTHDGRRFSYRLVSHTLLADR